jgi:anti-anti-sigma factor
VGEAITIEECAREPNAVVVRISGELDSTNARDTAEALLSYVGDDDPSGLVAELSGISYVDSAGVRAFVELGDRLERDGRALVLVAPGESRMSRVLSIVKMELLVPVYESVEAALGAIASPADD